MLLCSIAVQIDVRCGHLPIPVPLFARHGSSLHSPRFDLQKRWRQANCVNFEDMQWFQDLMMYPPPP